MRRDLYTLRRTIACVARIYTAGFVARVRDAVVPPSIQGRRTTCQDDRTPRDAPGRRCVHREISRASVPHAWLEEHPRRATFKSSVSESVPE